MKKIFFTLYLIFPSLILYPQDTLNVPLDYPTIQAAINAASNGDLVLVEDGTYIENINYKGKAITVASDFIIDGDTNHISNTIIDGSQPSHPDSGSVVTFNSGEDTTSVLCGFTITGGSGTYHQPSPPHPNGFRRGGGIWINAAGAKICHNIIKNNSVANAYAVAGGGLVSEPPGYDGFLIVADNIFDSNSCIGSVFSSGGGGIQFYYKFILSNNIIKNNLVSSDYGEAYGGGFAAILDLDSALVYNNILSNNKAETLYGTGPLDAALGAGLIIWNDTSAFIRVIGNIVAYNEVISSNASTGAGVLIEDVSGDVIVANNLVYGNNYSGTVSCYGTGLSVHDHTKVSIINNTIKGNESSPHGGALSIVDSTYTTSVLGMNNIFWGNSVGTAQPEIFVSAGNPPDVVYSDIEGGWTGTGNINVNPELMDTVLTSGDTLFAILSIGSPCIDAGDPDPLFYDPEDPNNIGYALWPSKGTVRNDMGAYGGPGAIEWGIVTDVNEEFQYSDEILTGFQLLQNYPNPFNPSTKIRYSVPQASNVLIKIFDILGNEIETLVNEEKPVGTYELTWYAENLPSGVYFYRIKAGSFVETKKMVLMK